MKYTDFDKGVQENAEKMAIAINGGDWKRDYSDAQKVGWCLKVKWAINNLNTRV